MGVGLGVLLAFLLFEVGIRHVPPDGMVVTNESIDIGTSVYTAPQDQQTIRDTYTAYTAAPLALPPFGPNGGHALTPDPSLVVFTWHGVPVESWTLIGYVYAESAGGLSDEFVVQHALPDITVPLPPPLPR